MKNIILLGIGNPGEAYSNTGHNAGSIVLNQLIKIYNGENIINKKTHLIMQGYKLNCFTNISYVNTTGGVLGNIMNQEKVDHQHLVVFHDHLDLPIGKWHYKFSSGTYGHKGLKSIKNLLQEKSFHKISVGIDRPSHIEEVAKYVLAPLNSAKMQIIEDLALEIYQQNILEKIILSLEPQ